MVMVVGVVDGDIGDGGCGGGYWMMVVAVDGRRFDLLNVQNNNLFGNILKTIQQFSSIFSVPI